MLDNKKRDMALIACKAVIDLNKLHQHLEEDDALHDDFFSIAGELTEVINKYIGVTYTDFIGDSYVQFCLDTLNGEFTPEEALKQFEELDIEQGKINMILHNLDMLDEYNDKIKNGVDATKSREIFDARFKSLLNYTNVPENKKLKYSNLLLDYVNGKKNEYEILEKFDYYIYR